MQELESIMNDDEDMADLYLTVSLSLPGPFDTCHGQCTAYP